MQLDELLDIYFSVRMLRPVTERGYRATCRTFVSDTGVRELDELDEAVFIGWRKQVLARACETTWNSYRRNFRVWMKFAVKREFVSRNPIEDVAPATVSNLKKKTVNVASLSRVVAGLTESSCPVKNGWFWSICIKTLFYTGMRRRQLVGLCWKDIDFKRNLIHLVSTTSKTKRTWEVPLDARLYNDLMYLKKETIRVLGARKNLSGRQTFCIQIFDDRNRFTNDRLKGDQLTGILRKIGQHYSIALSPHRLRHTFGTEVANAMSQNEEVPFGIRALQHQLGHTNITTTLGYIEPKPEQQRKIVDSLKTI
ncbi:MAG: site-specific integrase [Gammaproteobacteria bacterium]|nr:site-specific integrase [Gammaproteobacteria bacterium]